MARRSGMYKGEKRKKEVKRQKKQEEKRQRRLKNAMGTSQESEPTNSMTTEPESSGDIPEATDKTEDAQSS